MLVQPRSYSNLSSTTTDSSQSQDPITIQTIENLQDQLNNVIERLNDLEEKFTDQQVHLTTKHNTLNEYIRHAYERTTPELQFAFEQSYRSEHNKGTRRSIRRYVMEQAEHDNESWSGIVIRAHIKRFHKRLRMKWKKNRALRSQSQDEQEQARAAERKASKLSSARDRLKARRQRTYGKQLTKDTELQLMTAEWDNVEKVFYGPLMSDEEGDIIKTPKQRSQELEKLFKHLDSLTGDTLRCTRVRESGTRRINPKSLVAMPKWALSDRNDDEDISE